MCFEGVHRVMRRQVVAKQRADEVRNIQGSWFPIMMKRVKPISTSSAATVSGAVAVGRGDNKESDPGMPMCMIRLAAALHKVRNNGRESSSVLNCVTKSRAFSSCCWSCVGYIQVQKVTCSAVGRDT